MHSTYSIVYETQFFDLDIDNVQGEKVQMLYGNFDGGVELTDDERAQQINLCKSVYEILKEQFDIRYERINKWVQLCEKMILIKADNLITE